MPRRKQRNPGGRPPKFNVSTVLAIVAAVGQGKPRDEAAKGAGVGASTLYRWVQSGKAGDPAFVPLVDALRQADQARLDGSLARDYARLVLRSAL